MITHCENQQDHISKLQCKAKSKVSENSNAKALRTLIFDYEDSNNS